MAVNLLFCAIALASMASALPLEEVPNLCPETPGPYPFFYGHPDNCQAYYMCDHGKPILLRCAKDTRWSDVFKTCVGYNTHYDTCTRENAQRECSEGGAILIPHPTSCERYYNCTNTTPPSMYSNLGQYEDECTYPEVFDVTEKKCKSWKEAYCGPYRVAAKDPCDYLKNRCPKSHCIPCAHRMPSCVGLQDGLHEHPLRLWTPYYIECESERNIGPGYYQCPTHAQTNHAALFSPVKKACVSLWEIPREHGGLAPSCDGKTVVQSYRSEERPDVYYSCPGPNVFYCGAGNVFNESTQQCEASS